MIIDFNNRPPVQPFISEPLFSRPGEISREWGMSLPSSAMQKSMALFFEEMKEAGVSHCLLTGRAVSSYGVSKYNDGIAKLVTQYPDKFSGFGAVDPGDIPAAVAETERCIKIGLKGIILEPNVQFGVIAVTDTMVPAAQMAPPSYADDPKYRPIYAKCQEMGIPVMLPLSARLGPDLSYCSPHQVDHIAGEFPKLTIIVAHGCWPMVGEACGVAWRRRNVYLLPNIYGVNMPGHLHYVEAANWYLADRMLFGSVYPAAPMKEMVNFYRELPWGLGVIEKVMYQNAAKLLGL
ncbi:amidohydrolase family protein [Chloroflexota bacterium]